MKYNKEINIGNFLKQVKRPVILENNKIYKILGVKWYGKGMFLREEKSGKDIKTDKLFQVKTGDFVYNRLFAWKSSFAIVEKELDGCLVSNEFPTFEYDIEKNDPYFLLNYILQPDFIDYVNRQSGGMSSVSRKRFKEKDFITALIPDISIQEQKKISDKIKKNKNHIDEIDNTFSTQLTILKNLRQSILQEAVEGKLTAGWREKNPVKKDDPDTDAEVLLEKIREEKELPMIKADEKSFELPDGWEWAKLGEFSSIVRGGYPRPAGDKMYYNGNIPFLKVADLTADDNIYLNNFTYTIKEAGLYKTRFVEKNTLMLTNSGATLGIPKICTFPTTFNDGIAAFLGLPDYFNKVYLYYFLKSKSIWFLKEAARGQGQPNLNTDIIADTIFPLPPLAEQQVIVEQVDGLLANVDELEKQVTGRKALSEELMQAVLREAFVK